MPADRGQMVDEYQTLRARVPVEAPDKLLGQRQGFVESLRLEPGPGQLAQGGKPFPVQARFPLARCEDLFVEPRGQVVLSLSPIQGGEKPLAVEGVWVVFP